MARDRQEVLPDTNIEVSRFGWAEGYTGRNYRLGTVDWLNVADITGSLDMIWSGADDQAEPMKTAYDMMMASTEPSSQTAWKLPSAENREVWVPEDIDSAISDITAEASTVRKLQLRSSLGALTLMRARQRTPLSAKWDVELLVNGAPKIDRLFLSGLIAETASPVLAEQRNVLLDDMASGGLGKYIS